ncbi:MaoC/PaaZ C-terminal domain-containing protein [Aestuariirhabdus litorea]|uniref:MaoC-like domain-containing protein n=1 Tax=Aestuariirhabdus litorea TaxID=2528527 RepID=A0A3P3VKP8_9GAMM|nr:MaoC/PaaZ C-terminal domain-containing protein [Aestuariirhabdus litorea]RRJ82877.1 hypothetical protein D0544_13590 [Aestuariirhabdus litorea]RWW93036.1 hypothetical protein DZC74_13565 [Endozoicomonadaceae bacterium GTF-13]
MLLDRMPSLPLLLARILLRRKAPYQGQPLPPGRVRVEGIRINPAHLERYRRLIQCVEGDAGVPLCYPHLLSFPLQLSLITVPAFPLPLLGLVHLRNRIRAYRAINPHAPVQLESWLQGQNPTERGLEFELCTRLEQGGERVWESCSVNLYRSRTAPRAARVADRLSPLGCRGRWELPANLGRRYARLAGDYNPIHLFGLSARLFGFPRALIHGMWSKARCITSLQDAVAELGEALEVSCEFKTPLFLPGEALMSWQVGSEGGVDFLLQDGAGVRPHLKGVMRALNPGVGAIAEGAS